MMLADATILVVDDEPELLQIFAMWLGRNGCAVKMAANGVEAIKLLDSERIDAMVTDIRMPLMDGLTLVRRIYEMGLRVPSIIFVSGFGDVDVREAYGLGVEAMLPKPLPRLTLVKALEDSLKARTELWLMAPATRPEVRIEVTEASLEEAAAGCRFELGRGGCCVAWNEVVAEETPVALTVRFEQDGLELVADGVVRWCEPKEGRLGIEFTYVAPECRAWVVDRMEALGGQSFIPRCC